MEDQTCPPWKTNIGKKHKLMTSWEYHLTNHSAKIGSVMSNRGKTVISCTSLYINNILCVRVDLSNPKLLQRKQRGIRATNPPLLLILRPPPIDTIVASNHNNTSLAPTALTEISNDLDFVAEGVVQCRWPSLGLATLDRRRLTAREVVFYSPFSGDSS